MARVYEDLKGESMRPFLASFRSVETKENYCIKLRHFLNFSKLTVDELVTLANRHPKKVERLLFDYVAGRKDEGVSGSTIMMAADSIKLLLEMNDVETLNWKKIRRIIPPAKKHGNDRAPTVDEIRKLLLHVDLRFRCVVLILVSSGMRTGAFTWLTWGDVEPISVKKYRFAKLRIYAGESEEYTTFVTPECYEALLEYRRTREESGEEITRRSPLIAAQYNRRRFKPSDVKPASSKFLRNKLGELWNEMGLRAKEHKRYEFRQAHGFRKFFKSVGERFLKSIYVEMLMGHSTGVAASYMKPTVEELAEEYAKAIPGLSILAREEVTKDDMKKVRQDAALEAMRAVATTFGIDPMTVRIEKEREVGRELIGEEEIKLIQDEIKKLREPVEDPQMIVNEAELEHHLKDGWQLVSVLPSQKILIRK